MSSALADAVGALLGFAGQHESTRLAEEDLGVLEHLDRQFGARCRDAGYSLPTVFPKEGCEHLANSGLSFRQLPFAGDALGPTPPPAWRIYPTRPWRQKLLTLCERARDEDGPGADTSCDQGEGGQPEGISGGAAHPGEEELTDRQCSILETIPEPAGGQPADPAGPAQEPPGILRALMSARELADALRQPVPRVESFLRRYRISHPDCANEQNNPRTREPRFYYHTAEVWPALQAQLPRWRNRTDG
jgi:hypothetical protein